MTRKAIPLKREYGEFVECCSCDATHLKIKRPGPAGTLTLPVITKGSRSGTGCWTWNESTCCPTLKPSVLTENHEFRCHSFITDGVVKFLADSSHEMAETEEMLIEI